MFSMKMKSKFYSLNLYVDGYHPVTNKLVLGSNKGECLLVDHASFPSSFYTIIL